MKSKDIMNIKFSDLSFFNNLVREKIDKKLSELISESKFIGGKEKDQFEINFSKYTNSDFCVGVGNCTDALEIVLESMNFEKGSEVIVPSNSFIATSEAVTNAGLNIIFADCDPFNYTISLESIKNNISKKTKAIIVVHLFGHPANIHGVKEIIKNSDIKIIEDCAQAHGALINNSKVGSIGDAGVFSFYPGKNLGAFGDAGCIVTNNKTLAARCKMFSNHGREDKYNHQFEGRNSRLDTIQAAVLNIKLKHLDEINKIRIKNANLYLKHLSDIKEIKLPKIEPWAVSVFHQFVIRLKNREKMIKFLTRKGIETGIHYPIALPKLKAYEYLKKDHSSFFSMNNDKNILSIPVSEHLKSKEIMYVIETIKEFYNE